MSPRRNTTIGIGLGVLASLGVASYMTGRRAVPSWAGTLRLDDLGAPVEVVRDRWGVPALFAESEADLFRVQGYLHASDRLFQMDLYRRVAHGRLAEIVGAEGLRSDRLVRVLGFPGQIATEAATLEDDVRTVFEAYTAGINDYLTANRRRLPVEFRLLGYRPERWRVADCLSFTRLIALGLCGNWESELVRAEIAERFGADTLSVLDLDADARPFRAQIDVEVLGELASAARDATAVFGAGGGLGSNNWVIGPRRTESGGALLANDPHLDLTLPSIWYESLLRCPTYEARGFTVPGIPGVILGHNGRIAWGFTNSCADVQDLYLEEIDEQAGTYRDTDGTDKPLTIRTETISVKGRPNEVVTVRETRRGPILTDAIDHRLGQAISMRWDAVKPAQVASAAMRLNRARGFDDFREALTFWTCPAQNVVYADTDGNIGFQHAGLVPIRGEDSNNGTVPHRGDDPAGEWVGTIPFDEMPMAFNPTAERIVTANDRIVGDAYPYFISCEWMAGYRGERIRELIDESDGHTVERQNAIQCDVHSIPGREAVALLDRLDPEPATPGGRELLAALRAWDHELAADDDGAIAWRFFTRALQEQVFGFLGELLSIFLGYSRTGMNGFWCLFGRSTPRILHSIDVDDTSLLDVGASAHAEHGPSSAIAGWKPAASWREALALALDRAGRRYLGEDDEVERADSRTPPRKTSRLSIDRGTPHRRRHHRLRLQHPIGVVPGLAAVANHGPFPMPGDPDTVWQASTFNNPLNEHSMVGPSHRHVVDLADLDNSRAVVAGGQSGHPASPHYVDQVALWRNARTRPAPWSREAIERIARYHQRFEPGA